MVRERERYIDSVGYSWHSKQVTDIGLVASLRQRRSGGAGSDSGLKRARCGFCLALALTPVFALDVVLLSRPGICKRPGSAFIAPVITARMIWGCVAWPETSRARMGIVGGG